jgi:glycosyltransferase involved in cell wall biosynthesis
MYKRFISSFNNRENRFQSESTEIVLKNKITFRKKRKISVIIPVYNRGEFLNQCLDTVESQSLKEIEIICIDDGSTDNSLEIIKKHAEKDRRIKVISQDNIGVGLTRNKGIEESNSEFICFMDPDDYYPSNDVLEVLYSAAKQNGALIAGGSWSEDCKGEIKTEFTGIYSKYVFEEDGFVDYDDYQFDYGYHRFIYNRKMIIKNNVYFPPYRRFQDPPFFVKAMIIAGSFYAVKKQSYRYRFGHQNIEWEKSELCEGLIRGLIDNLHLSSNNNLAILHKITVDRINNDYSSVLINAVRGEEGTELLDLLRYANECVNWKLLSSVIPEVNNDHCLSLLVRVLDKTI